MLKGQIIRRPRIASRQYQAKARAPGRMPIYLSGRGASGALKHQRASWRTHHSTRDQGHPGNPAAQHSRRAGCGAGSVIWLRLGKLQNETGMPRWYRSHIRGDTRSVCSVRAFRRERATPELCLRAAWGCAISINVVIQAPRGTSRRSAIGARNQGRDVRSVRL